MDEFTAQLEALRTIAPDALFVRRYDPTPPNDHSPLDVVIYPTTLGEFGPLCRFTIAGGDVKIDQVVGGTDRLSAVLHAFYAVRHCIEALPGGFTWIGGPRMLGLPKQLEYGLGPHFVRHLEDLIDEEQAHATANFQETRRLWGEAPGRRYEDTPGYVEKHRASPPKAGAAED